MEKIFENENMNEVNNQNENVNPTVQDEMEQANTGASPVNYFKPMSIPGGASKAQPAPLPTSGKTKDNGSEKPATSEKSGVKAKKAKTAVEKDYKPIYTDQKKKELDFVSSIAKDAIQLTIEDSDIPTVPFGDHNCLIDLTAAYKNGINLLTPEVNRKHGKDKNRTGESIRMYGAQRHLLVITKSMADAASIKVARFSSDKRTGDMKDIDLVLIDGNGRVEYLLNLEEQDMPIFWATFIEPDASGYYNPSKAMEIINTNRLMWKTPDMVQKRLLDEGDAAHEGFLLIQELMKKGYMYQSACMTCTLSTDRIKVKEVNTGDANKIFEFLESAKKIHSALVEKFGEGDDKTLKTKEFPKEVSTLWHRLMDKFKEEEKATELFIKFIHGFKDTKVSEVLKAENDKNGMKKDDKRKKILNEQFNQFIGREDIELD